MDEWMDGQTDAWMDRWTDGLVGVSELKLFFQEFGNNHPSIIEFSQPSVQHKKTMQLKAATRTEFSIRHSW